MYQRHPTETSFEAWTHKDVQYVVIFTFWYSRKRFYRYTECINTPASGELRPQNPQQGLCPCTPAGEQPPDSLHPLSMAVSPGSATAPMIACYQRYDKHHELSTRQWSLATTHSRTAHITPISANQTRSCLVCRVLHCCCRQFCSSCIGPSALTKSSAIAEGPRDAPCQLKPCEMSHDGPVYYALSVRLRRAKSTTRFDDRYIEAKFSKSGACDKVPEGSTLFLKTPEFSFNTV